MEMNFSLYLVKVEPFLPQLMEIRGLQEPLELQINYQVVHIGIGIILWLE